MILELDQVQVQAGARLRLGPLSLRIAAGEMMALVGPNGAGKSTLLKLAAGLIRPGTGTIRLAGQSLDVIAPRHAAQLRAYLAQGETPAWNLTGRDLVGLGRLPFAGAFGRLTAADQAKIDQALTTTRAHAFADCPVATLSGGERARLMLARALAGTPRLLLVDEPFAHLDPPQQRAMMAVLRQATQSGMAVLIVLHDLERAALADRVALLARGQMIACGPPESVLAPAPLAMAYGAAFHVAHDRAGWRIVPLADPCPS